MFFLFYFVYIYQEAQNNDALNRTLPPKSLSYKATMASTIESLGDCLSPSISKPGLISRMLEPSWSSQLQVTVRCSPRHHQCRLEEGYLLRLKEEHVDIPPASELPSSSSCYHFHLQHCPYATSLSPVFSPSYPLVLEPCQILHDGHRPSLRHQLILKSCTYKTLRCLKARRL